MLKYLKLDICKEWQIGYYVECHCVDCRGALLFLSCVYLTRHFNDMYALVAGVRCQVSGVNVINLFFGIICAAIGVLP